MYLVAITLARGLVTIWRLNDPEERHKMLQDSVKENAALRAEVSRYRGMIEYARAAPDFSSCKSILADALDGVNGAENYEEVKGEREALRARCAVLEKVAEEIKRLREAVEELFLSRKEYADKAAGAQYGAVWARYMNAFCVLERELRRRADAAKGGKG